MLDVYSVSLGLFLSSLSPDLDFYKNIFSSLQATGLVFFWRTSPVFPVSAACMCRLLENQIHFWFSVRKDWLCQTKPLIFPFAWPRFSRFARGSVRALRLSSTLRAAHEKSSQYWAALAVNEYVKDPCVCVLKLLVRNSLFHMESDPLVTKTYGKSWVSSGEMRRAFNCLTNADVMAGSVSALSGASARVEKTVPVWAGRALRWVLLSSEASFFATMSLSFREVV